MWKGVGGTCEEFEEGKGEGEWCKCTTHILGSQKINN